MKEKHIVNLLEEAPFASLSESEHLEIQTHTANCSACAQAYQAARVSAALLLENAADAFEPTPFFHTRGLQASVANCGSACLLNDGNRSAARGFEFSGSRHAILKHGAGFALQWLFSGRGNPESKRFGGRTGVRRAGADQSLRCG